MEFFEENLPEQLVEEDNGDKETLEIIKKETEEKLKGISEFHGFEHTELVAKFSKLIALGENQDPFLAEAAGWTHDWGRAIEKDDEKKRPHAELSGIISKDFYRDLYEKKRIDAIQYGKIQRAVRRHSSRRETAVEPLKIVRDSDKLSRFGPLGLYHNVLGLTNDWEMPFYLEGEEIIRPENASIMERKDAKSVISMLNFCFDWRKMLETDSAKRIAEKLNGNYKAFLELFANHKDMIDKDFWLSFLKKYADEFKIQQSKFENDFNWSGNENDFEEWLGFYEKAGNPKIYSQENFQTFLEQLKNN